MGLLLVSVLLIAFSVLALIDGLYLHIIKYQLYKHEESKSEHRTHTVRAILFPLIIYFLFMDNTAVLSFYIGLLLILLDVIVLAIDAYIEKDSRSFMGGLPRWEYILHLFANGFHFASIAVFLATKLSFTHQGIIIFNDITTDLYFGLFSFISVNLLPGAIVLAIIHILTTMHAPIVYWNRIRNRLSCC